jgi:hypothetical protein
MNGLAARHFGRAAQVLATAALASASVWIAPAAALAAGPVAGDPAPTDAPTFTAACPEPEPGHARCFALIENVAGPAGAQPITATSPALLNGKFLEPADLQNAYGLTSAAAANGAGLTVAIVDAYHLANAESTLATYRSAYGLPACTSASGCFRQVDQNGVSTLGAAWSGTPVTNQGWNQEEALDLDMVSAICPLCNILLVEGITTSVTALGTAVNTAVALGADAVTNSYGAAETSLGGSSSEFAYDAYYNHPGVIVTASTGDCGYLSQLAPCNSNSAQYPSVSPYVVGVGGTSLCPSGSTPCPGATARGWTETAWTDAGSACSLYEPKPSWQTDPSCSHRMSADISAVSDPATGVVVWDPNGPTGAKWYAYGGTSAASPIIAAAYMLAGHPAAGSYPFTRLYANAASLYDITSGNNGSCGGSYLCTAGVGYDGPTGLGTPAGLAALAPDTKPGKPTGATAVRGNTQALVSWTAPVYAGTSPISGYSVLSTPGSFTCTTTGATGCVVSGLTNGQSYTFTVTASNASGAGPASDPSNAVTPAAVPDPPTGASAVRGNGSATVTWVAPVNGGGSPISLYTVTSTPGGLTCTHTTAAGCPVTGLTNGQSYTFTVTATNGVGMGLPSDPSAPVIPATIPGAPTAVVGVGSDSQAFVSWTAPASNGGTAILSYAVSSEPAGFGCVATGTTSCTVGGLTNRTPYRFTVVATNGVGPGAPSGPSAWVTPLAGATYVPLTPNRLVDSRAGAGRTGLGASLTSGVPASFQVTGRSNDATKNVPTTATAVTGNLTVVNQQSLGYLSLTPAAPVGAPTTSTLNFPTGDNRANGVTVPLGAGGVLWLTFVGAAGTTTDVVFDVTGYFVPNSLGATYVPLTPNRLVDSRAGAGRTGLGASLTSGVPASFQVTGRTDDAARNVPSTAIAVTGNLTVVNQHSLGYLSLTPAAPIGAPTTSTLNFPTGDIRANGVTVTLGPGGVLWLTFVGAAGTTTDVVFDVTGYFVPGSAGARYFPLTPNRLVDSRAGAGRTGLGASLVSGAPASFQVTGRTDDATRNVPSTAIAVTGNLTVVNQHSLGYLSLTPAAPIGAPTTSTLNFPTGDIRANGADVTLGPGGVLWVTFIGAGGTTTDVVFDVTGYFAV